MIAKHRKIFQFLLVLRSNIATAVGGVVVSKPMAKKTICRSRGAGGAIATHHLQNKPFAHLAPCAFACNKLCCWEPGTGNMSP